MKSVSITSRLQFVGFRNAFYGAIQQRARSAAYGHKVAGISASGKNAGNRASEACTSDDRVHSMRADYEVLREISALATPAQSDFDRAAAICVKHGIFQA
jgi:ribosomal protein S3